MYIIVPTNMEVTFHMSHIYTYISQGEREPFAPLVLDSSSLNGTGLDGL